MAKSNVKKISIGMVEKIIKENFQKNLDVDWYGAELKLKFCLGLQDILEFTDDCVKSCFQDGDYHPEILDLAVKSNIVQRYSNVSLPDNIERRYAILYGTDLVNTITKEINAEQLQMILDSISAKLEYLCNANVEDIQKRTDAVVQAFENMAGTSEAMFSNIDPEEFGGFIGQLSKGDIDEEKIVKAYIENTKTEDGEAGGLS